MVDRGNSRIGIHHTWFDLLWGAYLLTKTLHWGGVELPDFFAHYFTDLLCMPIVFGLSSEVLRWIGGELYAWLSPAKLIAGLIYFSIFFEFVLPKWNTGATGDPLDILCYLIGTIFFWYIQGVYSHFSSSSTVS